MSSSQTSVVLSPELRSQVQQKAADLDLSESAIIRIATRRFCEDGGVFDRLLSKEERKTKNIRRRPEPRAEDMVQEA